MSILVPGDLGESAESAFWPELAGATEYSIDITVLSEATMGGCGTHRNQRISPYTSGAVSSVGPFSRPWGCPFLLLRLGVAVPLTL